MSRPASVVSIRPRRDEDLPVLVEIVTRQQTETQYPLRWPWPGQLEEFIRRDGERAAWVAELDGRVVGHVALETVADEQFATMTARAHGVPVERLSSISVLFTDLRFARRGIGAALLDHATTYALAAGDAPVLDVVADHAEPVQLYLSRGWREVGRFRPDWLTDDLPPVRVMIFPRS